MTDTLPSKTVSRYRTPGATTDLVMLAFSTPGIEIDRLISAVQDKCKTRGTTRDTIRKLVNQLIREGHARREGTRLYLTDVFERAWEASPLVLES